MPDEEAKSPKAEKPDPDVNSGLSGVLLWLVKKGPIWARIPAIFATICATVISPTLLLVNKLGEQPKVERSLENREPAAAQLDMATSAKLSSDESMIEAAFNNPDLPEEERKKMPVVFRKVKHGLEHLVNPKDQVPWTIFAKDSSKDYFGYKVFPSDRCLLIARIEDGQGTSEWLADPNRPLGTSVPLPPDHKTNPQSKPGKVPGMVKRGAKNVHFENLSYAIGFSQPTNEMEIDLGEGIHLPTQLDKTPIQGTCLNPHPGNFSATSGPPINQCQVPVFRRWSDGCSHVQVFDHCRDLWGPVVWQTCASFHHP